MLWRTLCFFLKCFELICDGLIDTNVLISLKLTTFVEHDDVIINCWWSRCFFLFSTIFFSQQHAPVQKFLTFSIIAKLVKINISLGEYSLLVVRLSYAHYTA